MATSFRDRRAPSRVGAALLLSITLAGCAQFPEEHSRAWHPNPSLEPKAGPKPYVEGQQPPPSRIDPPETSPPPPRGCHDPDPAVVATCLNPVGAIAVLPNGRGALVGERSTGRVLRVSEGSAPVEVARIPVDPTGGGGLTGLTLSPSYAEDQLAYAYATTATGNRVVRIARGDPPEPIVTGIPRGPSGNAGAITTDGKGALLVATGDAGSPALAADPASLAGKVLRINAFGDPAEGNPAPAEPVVSSGVTEPGGMCAAPGGSAYWITDHERERDALYRLRPGEPLGEPSWTWQDDPGASACMAMKDMLVVGLTDAEALYTMRPAASGGFTGEPRTTMRDTYGRFSAAARGPNGLLWLGTANKAGGSPVSSDDRVIRVKPPAGGTAGKD